MAGFVFSREQFVGLREAVLQIQSGMMDAKRVGACMRVMVRRARIRIGALLRDNRYAAVRPDDVLYEMSCLAHHWSPSGLVPPNRSVFERDMKMTVVVHRRCDFVREPCPYRVHGDRTCTRHLAHDVDIVDA